MKWAFCHLGMFSFSEGVSAFFLFSLKVIFIPKEKHGQFRKKRLKIYIKEKHPYFVGLLPNGANVF